MPQMSPMWWMTIMIMIIMMIMTINTIIYFNKNYKMKNKMMKKLIKINYWKW